MQSYNVNILFFVGSTLVSNWKVIRAKKTPLELKIMQSDLYSTCSSIQLLVHKNVIPLCKWQQDHGSMPLVLCYWILDLCTGSCGIEAESESGYVICMQLVPAICNGYIA